MARVLHLLKTAEAPLAEATIARDAATGHEVTVALLHGTAAPTLPETVRVHRVPGDLSYGELLDRIFEADQVITW